MKTPSHAGGVVVRTDGADTLFLLVSARREPNAWVLPKGHIEPGESPEATAAREVLEESGVIASVGPSLGIIEFENWRGHVCAEFFLMRYEGEGRALEKRKRAWRTLDETIASLGFADMRRLVLEAHAVVAAR